jgi:hypothetical protein
MSIAHMFQEAGTFGYVAVVVAVLAIVVLTLGPRLPEGVAWVLPLAPLFAGAAGYVLSLQVVDNAVAMVEPAMRDVLRAEGLREARQNLIIGGALVAVVVLAAFVTRARRR